MANRRLVPERASVPDAGADGTGPGPMAVRTAPPSPKESDVPLQWFFTRSDGERLGPFMPRKLQQMASDGQLCPNDRAREMGRAKTARERILKRVFIRPDAQS